MKNYGFFNEMFFYKHSAVLLKIMKQQKLKCIPAAFILPKPMLAEV